MRVLSFDVGIKNLAFCLIDVDPEDKNKFQIINWGTIDTSEESVQRCDMCTKPAKFMSDAQNEKLCGVHRRKFINSFSAEIKCKRVTKPSNCSHPGCNSNKAYYVIDNTQFCASHRTIVLKKTAKEHQLKEIKKINVMKMDLAEISAIMAKKLDAINFGDLDRVVIENQPQLKNPRMGSVQMFVASYFVIREKVDKKRNVAIRFCLASNKLKYDKKRTEEMLKGKSGKPRYEATKKLGQEYAEKILCNLCTEGQKWVDILKTHTKKDDLCDSLLQAYYDIYLRA